jgi:hypothetical protein
MVCCQPLLLKGGSACCLLHFLTRMASRWPGLLHCWLLLGLCVLLLRGGAAVGCWGCCWKQSCLAKATRMLILSAREAAGLQGLTLSELPEDLVCRQDHTAAGVR